MARFSNDHYALIGRMQTLDGTVKDIIKKSGKLNNDQLSNEDKESYIRNVKDLCEDAIILINDIEKIEQHQNSVVEIGGN